MFSNEHLDASVSFNKIIGIIILLFITLVTEIAPLHASPRNHSLDNLSLKIDNELGEQIIENLRNQRLKSDYYLEFQVEALERRKKGKSAPLFYGRIWGSWNEKGPVNRIIIYKNDSTIKNKTTFLAQNGPTPQIWRYIESQNNRENSSPSIEELKGISLFGPLALNIDFTPFDVLMPFIFWPDYEYEGKTRVGRQVHQFIMFPPANLKEAMPRSGSIRMIIDDQFGALKKIEMLDATKKTYRSFRIRSFQKVEDQYLIKEIDFFDEIKRSKTRFTVNFSKISLSLSPEIFLPENLDKKFAFIESATQEK